MDKHEVFSLASIGYVKRNKGRTYLEILKPYIPALRQLEHFSHVHVLWWFSELQDGEARATTQVQPPYQAPISGVFAVRSPRRPNPIALTTAPLVRVDHKKGVVEIANLDAYDGTPILDLKPHMPTEDRVRQARVPEWMADWPEWMPEQGHALQEEPAGAARRRRRAETFEIFPVGYVRQKDGQASLHILQAFIPALEQLEHFSHVRVLWWFHRFQDERFRKITQNTPPYEHAPVTGVFASRSPVRPNPIALTTVRITNVNRDQGIVEVAGLDAYDGTPIVDLKPYIPAADRVREFRVPAWIAHRPEWYVELEATSFSSCTIGVSTCF